MAPSLAEQLSAAGSEVDRAGSLLLSPSPEKLDQCAILLERAVAKITACQAGITAGEDAPPQAFEEGLRLQASIRRARRLLEAASEYHQNWLRRLGAMSSGYTDQGQPAAVGRGGRMVIRG